MRTLHPTLWIVCLCSFFNTFAQTPQILVSENFNDCSLPNDWQVTITGDGPAIWYVNTPQNPNTDGSSVDGTCMLIMDDEAGGNNTPPYTLELLTPFFDGSDFATLTLDADIHFNNFDGSASLTFFVTDGIEYMEVAKFQGNDGHTGEQFSEFIHLNVDLSFYASPNMAIAIQYDDGGEWVYWAGIDNFSVTGSGSGSNLLSENFDSCGIPPGWTTEVLRGSQDWIFGFNNSNNPNKKSMNGSCFVHFDDAELPDDTIGSKVRLFSPPFSGLEHRNYYLDMDFIWRRRKNDETFKVYIYDGNRFHKAYEAPGTTGGPNFGDDVHLTVDLSKLRAPHMQLMFEYNDHINRGFWVGIDNVKVTGVGEVNDLCAKALPLTLDSVCIPGNNQTALFDGPQPNCAADNIGSLWYTFEAPSDGLLRIITNSGFNDVVTVFQGACDTSANALTPVNCTNKDEFGFEGEQHYLDIIAGASYFFRISGKDKTFGVPRGDLCMQLDLVDSLPTTPSNDLCANAFWLEIGGDCVASTNVDAGFEGPEPILNTKSKADIWYKFVPTVDTLFSITTEADFSEVLTLYEGTCGNLTEVAGNDYGRKLEVENLTVGDTFYVQVSSYFATTEGSVCASVHTMANIPPANDLCALAQPIAVGSDCVAATNANASFSGIAPSCEPNPQSDIWFSFVAPNSGGIKFNSNADFHHILTFYKGDSCTNLEEVACFENPMRCAGFVQLNNLELGDQYWIQICSADLPSGHQYGKVCIELIDILDNDPYQPIALTVTPNCIGDGLAFLEINPTGGQGDYSFVGNTESDTLSDGTPFVVVVSDDMGCEASVSGNINCSDLPCELETSLIFENVSCFGEEDGSATIEVINASDDLMVEWSNGSTGYTISDLAAGSYAVTVSDGPTCLIIQDVGVTQPDPLFANTASTGISGQGAEDGSVMVDPMGGNPPYSVLWSTNDTTLTVDQLAAGTYSVTIEDASGCSAVESVVVQDFLCVVQLLLTVEDVNCFGGQDGTIQVEVSGGAGPFTYEWNNGMTTDLITDLEPGIYEVTVTDGNNCSYIESGAVVQPDEALAAVLDSTVDNVCFGGMNGVGVVSASGGTPPFNVEWSNGATGFEVSNLPAGTYTAFITDANGCQQSVGVPILEPDAIEFEFDVNSVLCAGEPGGSAAVNAVGGTPPFDYLWNDPNGQTTFTAANLPAGSYEVTITDTEGCTAVGSTQVEEPPALEIFVDSVGPSYVGEGNGFAAVTVSGGTAPYNYFWILDGMQVADVEDLTDAEPGTYVLTVQDANGCIIDSEEIIIDGIVAAGKLESSSGVLFDLAPNPSKGSFIATIQVTTPKEGKIMVYDGTGKLIGSRKQNFVGTVHMPFIFNDLPKGVYAIQLVLQKEIFTKRMILQ